jgi:hypothetical protein
MQAPCISGKTFVGERVLLICHPKRLHRPDALLVLLTENVHNCSCLNRINARMGIYIHPQVAGVGAEKTVIIEVPTRIATAKVSHFLSALCRGCASQLIPNCTACFIKLCEAMHGLEVVPANCSVPKEFLQTVCYIGRTPFDCPNHIGDCHKPFRVHSVRDLPVNSLRDLKQAGFARCQLMVALVKRRNPDSHQTSCSNERCYNRFQCRSARWTTRPCSL